MLKNNTKITLIGLLVLGVLGLIYGYLNTRPEMIADNQLRVPEVTSPEFEKMINKSTASVEKPEPKNRLLESTSDVEVLSGADEFVDLNLTETKPLQMVLLEGDNVIIDDVNEIIETYQNPKSSNSVNTTKQVTSTVKKLSKSSGDKSINLPKNSNDEVEQEQLVLTGLPIPDEALVAGTDPVSLEYQASYRKLKITTERLIKANARNADLKDQFKSMVGESERLAQVIRDIDDEIKVFVVKK